MHLRIDPHRGPPIFEQIVFGVKRAVAEGHLAEGDKLPSVRDLARDLAVNPNTVVRAMEALERDGVITRRQGAGCFVAARTGDRSGRARRQKLDDLLRHAVTEAFHLGCDQEQIRQALERSLSGLTFDDQRKVP